MDDYTDLTAMRKATHRELMEWKTLMKDLAGAFYRLFPATRKYGWTLHLDNCAKSKKCSMCPHSLTWARYYHVDLHEETKQRRLREGKDAPKSWMSWDNTKDGTYAEELPKRLMVSRKDRQIHIQFEAVRKLVMEQHVALSELHRKLLAKERHWQPGRPIGFFDGMYSLQFLQTVLPARQIKVEVIRKIEELRTL